MDLAQTWWEALGGHGDSEVLKSFHSDIQWRFELKLGERQRSDMEIQISVNHSVSLSKMPAMRAILKQTTSAPEDKSGLAETWWRQGNSESLK